MVLFTKRKVYTGSISSEWKNIFNEVEKKWRRNTFSDKYWKNPLLANLHKWNDKGGALVRSNMKSNRNLDLCKEINRTRSGINESKIQFFSYFLMI